MFSTLIWATRPMLKFGIMPVEAMALSSAKTRIFSTWRMLLRPKLGSSGFVWEIAARRHSWLPWNDCGRESKGDGFHATESLNFVESGECHNFVAVSHH